MFRHEVHIQCCLWSVDKEYPPLVLHILTIFLIDTVCVCISIASLTGQLRAVCSSKRVKLSRNSMQHIPETLAIGDRIPLFVWSQTNQLHTCYSLLFSQRLRKSQNCSALREKELWHERGSLVPHRFLLCFDCNFSTTTMDGHASSRRKVLLPPSA